MLDDFIYFFENYDFDMVLDWVTNADWGEVAANPMVYGPLVALLAMLAVPKVSHIAQALIVYVPFLGFFFVAATVLHNDDITNVGPFILAISCFFITVGWFLYNKMLKS